MTPLANPLDAALANPWETLGMLVDGPLHPGGVEASDRLLGRAGVSAGTTLLDVGCGAGDSVSLARERGATAVGLDRRASEPDAVRGDMTALPVRTGSVDVVLAECVLCLANDLDRALAEARRVVDDDGRLALSDVVVDDELPALPDRIAEALCLTGQRERTHLRERIEAAGFSVRSVEDHRDDLLEMREEVAARVDYHGLLGALGGRGQELSAAIEGLEAAVEDGRVGYVSLVADAEP